MFSLYLFIFIAFLSVYHIVKTVNNDQNLIAAAAVVAVVVLIVNTCVYIPK